MSKRLKEACLLEYVLSKQELFPNSRNIDRANLLKKVSNRLLAKQHAERQRQNARLKNNNKK